MTLDTFNIYYISISRITGEIFRLNLFGLDVYLIQPQKNKKSLVLNRNIYYVLIHYKKNTIDDKIDRLLVTVLF